MMKFMFELIWVWFYPKGLRRLWFENDCSRASETDTRVMVQMCRSMLRNISLSFTWMRHLLTSLAQRALLQPEVIDGPDRRKRRATVAAAGRIAWRGLILMAHQHGTGNTYINNNTIHSTDPQRANKQHGRHSRRGREERQLVNTTAWICKTVYDFFIVLDLVWHL